MMVDQNSTEQQLRNHFISWQCRIRQHAVRMQGGRPTEGMQTSVLIGNEVIASLIVLINKKELAKLITEFRFMYKKTEDPALRRDAVLKVLVAGYFQQVEDFSDRLTASLSPDSEIAKRLLEAKEVLLYFQQHNQQYKIPCLVQDLKPDEHEYQVTYWHNSLFNPNIPPNLRILAFEPDWSTAQANPMPNEFTAVPNYQ